jgi:hypothetical protein
MLRIASAAMQLESEGLIEIERLTLSELQGLILLRTLEVDALKEAVRDCIWELGKQEDRNERLVRRLHPVDTEQPPKH